MALFGTLLVLLVGLLGRRVGRAVPRVERRRGRSRRGRHRRDLAEHLGERRARHVGDAHRRRGGQRVPARVRAVGPPEPAGARPRSACCCGIVTLGRAELVLFVPLLGVVVALTTQRSWADRAAFAFVVVIASRGRDRARGSATTRAGSRTARSCRPTTASRSPARTATTCSTAHGIGLTSITGPNACIDNPPPPGDQSQVEAVYRKRAMHYMRTHLRRLPIVVAARIGRTWSLYRPLDMVAFNKGEGREPWVTRLGLVRVLPDADRRDRGRDHHVAAARPARALGAARARDRGDRRRRGHLRADAISRRGRAVARDPRRGRGVACRDPRRAPRMRRAASVTTRGRQPATPRTGRSAA